MKKIKVFVSSRSFSKNEFLRKKLLSTYPLATFNNTGKKLTNENFIKLAFDAEKIIVALDKIDKSVLKKLPNLKVISKYGVGLDNLNLKDIENYKIKLGWSQGQNSRAVAELVIGYIFSITRDIFNYQTKMKHNLQFDQNITGQVSNKSIGIIGFGSIGSELARLLSPFNCKIFYNDIRKINTKNPLHTQKSFNFVMKNCDIISIHVPLTSLTKDLINKNNINLLKKNLLLINCSRGGIINEVSLYNFLNKNKTATAAFDVFQNEPPIRNKLLKLKNFYCTPHIGGSTKESILNMGLSAINGLDNFINFKKLYQYGY